MLKWIKRLRREKKEPKELCNKLSPRLADGYVLEEEGTKDISLYMTPAISMSRFIEYVNADGNIISESDAKRIHDAYERAKKK